jgi:hypothetical protein
MLIATFKCLLFQLTSLESRLQDKVYKLMLHRRRRSNSRLTKVMEGEKLNANTVHVELAVIPSEGTSSCSDTWDISRQTSSATLWGEVHVEEEFIYWLHPVSY